MKVHFDQQSVTELLPSKHILARHMCLHVRPDLDPRDLWNHLGFSLDKGGNLDILLNGQSMGYIEPLDADEEKVFVQTLVYENNYPKWCLDIINARYQASLLARRAKNEAIKAEVDKQHQHLSALPWQAKCLTVLVFTGVVACAVSRFVP